MKTYKIYTYLFSFWGLFIFNISLSAQLDNTRDNWEQHSSDNNVTYLNTDNNKRVSIGSNFASPYADLTISGNQAYDPDTGLPNGGLMIMQQSDGTNHYSGRIGFHSGYGNWGASIISRHAGAGRYNFEFVTKHGFWDDYSESTKMFLTPDGNLGIGTTNPFILSRLHVVGSPTANSMGLSNTWPAVLARGGVSFGAAGNDNPGCWISSYNDINHDGVIDSLDIYNLANSSTIGFYTDRAAGGGGATPHMVIMGWDQNNPLNFGYVGLGTTNPQYRLDVCGEMRVKEIFFEDAWCDFVFYDDYQLPSLEKEAEHIQDKRHLLGFESEQAMEGQIKVLDVTKRQQQKLEEAYLHLIELNEENKFLKNEVADLKNEVQEIKSLLLKLSTQK